VAHTDTYFPFSRVLPSMYVGRFVVVAPTQGAYRVSSRSFPNRAATRRGDTVTVGPTENAPETDNPYIAYNAVRRTDGGVVLGNGSHVDPIAEKLSLGTPARDAAARALLALDFEKDDYDTPRIAGVVGVPGTDPTTTADGPGAVIGTVRRDALLVEEVTEPTLVATYERDDPEPFAFDAGDAEILARAAYELDFEHPVCAAGVSVGDGDAGEGDIDVAVYNG
jgi:IMP cyclohydrolase